MPSVKSSEGAFSNCNENSVVKSSESSGNIIVSNCGSEWRFWASMIIFTITAFFGGVVGTLLATFYTKEATRKSITVSQAGLVFGSKYFVHILFIPIFGKYLNTLGAHRVLVSGIFVAGTGNTLFGLLEWVNHMQTFLALSFAIRIISATGEAAFMTALYPLATKAAGESALAKVISVMETAFGIGIATGTTIGGILYDYNGFYLPFVIVGGALIFCSIVATFIIDKSNANIILEGESQSYIGGSDRLEAHAAAQYYCNILAQAEIITPMVILTVSEMSIAWFNPTLEPFLGQNFSLSSTWAGIMLSLQGGTSAAFSLVCGMLLDRGVSPYFIMICGVVCQIVGLSLMGPARYVEFVPKSPYSTGIGLFIMGCGIAASSIVTLTFMLKKASYADQSCPSIDQTRGMITSLWLIAESIGDWLGSILGGIAYFNLGFEDGSLVIVGLQFIIVVGIAYLWYQPRPNERKNYKECDQDATENTSLSNKISHTHIGYNKWTK